MTRPTRPANGMIFDARDRIRHDSAGELAAPVDLTPAEVRALKNALARRDYATANQIATDAQHRHTPPATGRAAEIIAENKIRERYARGNQ